MLMACVRGLPSSAGALRAVWKKARATWGIRHLIQGAEDKLNALAEPAQHNGVSLEQIAFSR